jgi:hypothetical protein
MNSCPGPGPPSTRHAAPLDELRSWIAVVPSGLIATDPVPSGSFNKPSRAALRQSARCCGEISCRRATSETTAPGAQDSATICALTSSHQRRRRARRCNASTTSVIMLRSALFMPERILKESPSTTRWEKMTAYPTVTIRSMTAFISPLETCIPSATGSMN